MSNYYYDYSTYLKSIFKDRVQKLTINAGFSCPNRDGKISFGGCTYCNNATFSPSYCSPEKSITQQIEEGIIFFSKKYKNQNYLAYFQSYTNTYAPLEKLKNIYEEAINNPKISGIVIGTRPDCINQQLIEYLANLASRKYVMVEYGVESTHDTTLLNINRGHNYQTAVDTIKMTAEYGIHTSAHLILGLPGENEDIILSHADRISELPIKTLKLHQLQIIKGTKMGKEYTENPEKFKLYTSDEYLTLLTRFIARMSPSIALERFISQSPADLLIAPRWGIKNYEFTAKLEKKLAQTTTYQGAEYKKAGV